MPAHPRKDWSTAAQRAAPPKSEPHKLIIVDAATPSYLKGKGGSSAFFSRCACRPSCWLETRRTTWVH